MNRLDQWFRWCFNFFVFLLCFQLGMLLFLKSLYYKAEQKLKESEAPVSFACGDFDSEESYWKIKPSLVPLAKACSEKECPESLWVGETKNQEKELHVLSVERPQPTRRENGKTVYGHFVDVEVQKTEKPVTLVLINQSLMQWNIKAAEDANIEKVIVASPEIVWVDGLKEDIPLVYFPREKLCAYPKSWKELDNPENEYRRLARALQEYTGLEIDSFQGRSVGQYFRLPVSTRTEEPARRQVSSNHVSPLSLGLQWQRKEKSIVAKDFRFHNHSDREVQKIEVPEKTQSAVFDDKEERIYLIKAFRFGVWDWDSSQFKAIHLPLKFPSMNWPTSMAFDSQSRKIYIYNEERGGEIYIYDTGSRQWSYRNKPVGYSLSALTFVPKDKKVYGARVQGNKVVEVVKLDSEGKPQEQVSLEKPLDYSKTLWRMQLVADPNQLWLKVVHPAHPGGDVYPLPL